MSPTKQEKAVARGLPFTRWHLVITVTITAFGFPIARDLADAEIREVYFAVVSLMGMIGLSIVSFVALIAEYNREARRTGRLVLAVQDYALRHRDFLTDNPWLASNETVRRTLLPSYAELRIFSFHPSMAKTLAECLAGSSWTIKDGVLRGGGASDTRLAPELEATRHYAAKLEELRRENFNLKAELQILRRQCGFDDGKAAIQ